MYFILTSVLNFFNFWLVCLQILISNYCRGVFFFTHSRSNSDADLYHTVRVHCVILSSTLCEKKSFISSCLLKDLVLTHWTSVASVHSGTKFLQCSKRWVELSRHIQNALLNRSLCILCTPGHRWWNKRLWLYFSSSTVICIFMSFQKRKEKNHVIYTFIYWCTIKRFFGGGGHCKQKNN